MNGFYKSTGFILIFFLLISCGPKRDEAETKLFSLENVLVIDTEDNKTAEIGLTDIRHFDIDSEGNIFIANLKSKENYIFKLDKEGRLITAFGRKGQGPGEFQSPMELVVSKEDEVFITDRGKAAVFNNGGRFIREFRIDNEYQKIIPLDRDRYLTIAVRLNEDLSQSFQVILCSSGLEELKTLDSSKIESFNKATKVNVIPTLVFWEKSNSRIYTGNTDEYVIRMFDFDGTLIRGIKKEHAAVLLSDEDRERYEKNLQRYPPEIKGSFFIPDTFPPFKDLVALGDQWLFVQTYERSNERGSVYDMFDANGEFAGRTEFEGDQVKFKGDRVYCLREKESGYKELVIYRMIWE